MIEKTRAFNGQQKQKLLEHARNVIASFKKGVVLRDDPNPHDWGEYGAAFSDQFLVRFTEEYLTAQYEFTSLAAKMLKARHAHEKTIRTFCQKAGQEFINLESVFEDENPAALEKAAKALVEKTLAEAGREFLHIEPNFLIRHAVSDIIVLGRVRSMRTDFVKENTPLSNNERIRFKVGGYPKQDRNKSVRTFCMPSSVWVVNVAATKENVAEEAKWLIDVAVSFMRLSVNSWKAHYPRVGSLELHPTQPPTYDSSHVTLERNIPFSGGLTVPGWYETDQEVVNGLNVPDIQSRAEILFDPPEKTLGQRVAQGLGWMTRSRQVADRAERLLSLFTALEALLSSDDKSAPVTQTISRHLSVIYTQDIKSRITVYNQIKALYALRSEVVHAGKREVLWQDVNNLQSYTETVYWIVLNRCDLTMRQDRFAQSLTDASHGLRWEFAASAVEDAVLDRID